MSGWGITRGLDVELVDLGLVQRGAFADGDEDVRGRTVRPGRRRIVERGMPRGRRNAGIEDVDAILEQLVLGIA